MLQLVTIRFIIIRLTYWFIQFNARCVLTVNQVFEIMLAKISNKSWKESMLEVLPTRKLNQSLNQNQVQS